MNIQSSAAAAPAKRGPSLRAYLLNIGGAECPFCGLHVIVDKPTECPHYAGQDKDFDNRMLFAI